MKTPDLIKLLETHKGQILKACWRRKIHVRKECPHKIEKSTKASVRVGISFSNISRVKMDREMNDKEAGGLPFGEWVVENILLRHKNVDYLRIYNAFANTKPFVQYFMDGKEVSKEEIAPFCLASELKSEEKKNVCFTIKLENLESITASKKVYRLK